MSEHIVAFQNVTKVYKLYKNDKKRLFGLFSRRVPYQIKKAVNDISFSVERGDALAIFGKNGAGKSTILKMMTGVTYPTAGEITVNGRVSALLELTTGFDPEFTGRENIFLKGQLLGIANEEMRRLEPAITDFAEIDEYIDQPVRTYSSGMKARLGFSICVNTHPEILIVDEALSVGDAEFKNKCLARVNELLREENITLIFVSHSVSVAKSFCRRGLVVEKGKIIFDGAIEEAAARYEATLGKKK